MEVNEGELLLRQQIRNAFENKRPQLLKDALPVPLKRVVWEPASVLGLELLLKAGLFVSAAIIWVVTREVR
jgi:hypothetical protein